MTTTETAIYVSGQQAAEKAPDDVVVTDATTVQEAFGREVANKTRRLLNGLKQPSYVGDELLSCPALPVAALAARGVTFTRDEVAEYCAETGATNPHEWVREWEERVNPTDPRTGDNPFKGEQKVGPDDSTGPATPPPETKEQLKQRWGKVGFEAAILKSVNAVWALNLLAAREREDANRNPVGKDAPKLWFTGDQAVEHGATDDEMKALARLTPQRLKELRMEAAAIHALAKQQTHEAARRKLAEEHAEAAIASIRERVTLKPSDHMDDEPLEPLWGEIDGCDVLVMGSDAALVGERGTYKSSFTHHLVAAACLGIDDLFGQPVYQPVDGEQHRVLMIVGEAEDMVWTGVCAAARNLGWKGAESPLQALDGQLIMIPRIDLDTDAGRAVVAEYATEFEPTMVINDTMARNRSAEFNENSATDSYALTTGVRKAVGPKPLVIHLHHPAKGTNVARGSGAFDQSLDTVIVLERGRRKDSPVIASTQKLKRGPSGVEVFAVEASKAVIDERDMSRDSRGRPRHGIALKVVDPYDETEAERDTERRQRYINTAMQRAILVQVCAAIEANTPLAASFANEDALTAVKAAVAAAVPAGKVSQTTIRDAVKEMLTDHVGLLVKRPFKELAVGLKDKRQNGEYLQPGEVYPESAAIAGSGVYVERGEWAEIVALALKHHGFAAPNTDE
jgi:hypothetical protein